MNEEIELGDLVRDQVSGVEGIAVSRHSYLTGCTRFGVQKIIKKKKGIPPFKSEPEVFDEPQLEIIEKGKVKIKFKEVKQELETSRKGGPIYFFPKEKAIEVR